MRIGLFSDTYAPDINGVASSVGILENALKKLGHEVFIITNHNRLHIEMVGNVLLLPGIELKKLYGYTMSGLYSFKGKAIIEKMQLDIIHVHTEFGVGLFGRIVAKALNIPLVSTYHTAYEDYTHYVNVFDHPTIEKYSKKAVSKLSKTFANATKAVIAPSEKTKKSLLSYGVDVPIYEIPTGLNLRKFKEIEPQIISNIKKDYNIKENEKIVVFVGRIAAEKNIIMLIDAFKYVENMRLMIVGDGPQLQDLKSYVAQLNIQNKVIFTGKKENRIINHFYNVASCFASASTSETQGMTYIEALACGKVVFARRDEVVKTLITENENGYFFDNEKELAQKLNDFNQLPHSKLVEMAHCAEKSVEIYDDITFGKRVVKMYEEVLEEKTLINEIRFEKKGIRIITDNASFLVDMDTYLDEHLAKGKYISKQKMEQFIEKHNNMLEIEKITAKIANKMYTEKEVLNMLGNLNVDKQQWIEHFKAIHLIDDAQYVEAFLAQSKLALYSNKKIMNLLAEKGIDIEIERDEKSAALKLANKLVKTSSLSIVATKNKIRQKLYENRFDVASIQYALENVEITISDDKQQLLKNKTLEKANRLYSKYEGFEKQRRIKLYLKTKGFNVDED